jgi:hypothetical protein
MTLGDIIARLTIGVMRDDLAQYYPTFINEALVEIQRRRSWQCMRAVNFFTILNGASTVSLLTTDGSVATRFKELSIGKSPVHLQFTQAGSTLLTPCDVWPREKLLRRQARLISNSLLYSVYSNPSVALRTQVPVYVDWQAGQPVLNILFPAQSDLPFSVSYYGYLADLDPANPADSNEFTAHYSEMVVAKSKAIAFAAINDPVAGDFEVLFDKKFKDAAAQDAYQAVAGMDLRM